MSLTEGEALVRERLAAARARWPAVKLDDADFHRHLAASAPADPATRDPALLMDAPSKDIMPPFDAPTIWGQVHSFEGHYASV